MSITAFDGAEVSKWMTRGLIRRLSVTGIDFKAIT